MRIILFVLLITLPAWPAGAQLLLEENFAYLAGDRLTGHGWTRHSGSGNDISVSLPVISWPGYLSSGIGNETSLSGAGEDVNRVFGTFTTGALYLSFLVNVTAATPTGDYFIHFGRYLIGTTYKGKVFVKRDATGNLAFGIAHSSSQSGQVAWSPFIYSCSITYLLVMKYSFLAGNGNDQAVLFIDPDPLGSEPGTGLLNTDLPTDPVEIGSVALRQGSGENAPALRLDGIRIGRSWEDILHPLIPDTLTIVGHVLAGSQKCFNATLTVMTAVDGMPFKVHTGGEAALITGENILFLPGTVVEPGGSLLARVTHDGTYCQGNTPPRIRFGGLQIPVGSELPAIAPEVLDGGWGFSVRIFPNPTSGRVHLVFPSGGGDRPVTITIFRASGEKVKDLLTKDNPFQTIDLEPYPYGIYLIRIQSEGSGGTWKVLVSPN
jgi:hypothetical protein